MATSPQDIQDASKALITSITADADSAVQRLESIASVPFQLWTSFSPSDSIELSKAETVVTSDDFPTLEKVSFDTSIGEFDPNAYKSNVYESDFFTFLEPYLTAQIDAGGPGISTDVQNAIFNTQREQDLQTMADALDAVRVNYGKTGFPLPTQVMRGQENDVVKRYQDVKAERARGATALIAERAADFVKTAIRSGIDMEQTRANFALGFARLFNDITSALINRFRAEQDARVTEFKGQIDVILGKLQVGKINAEIDIKFQEQLLNQWQIESTQAIEKTKALIQQGEQATSVKLSAAATLANYYSALAASAASQITGIAGVTENTELTSA